VLSIERRGEIAAFLRVRRTRRQPEDVGLPRGRRRRTPGLRREEVAALAGVSAEWYTWLEQAREVRPSVETLRRIADALRLEPAEAQHLLTLAGYGIRDQGHPGAVSISPRIQRLLDELTWCPAWVYGERWDILAWNRAATVIYGDIAATTGVERNSLYHLFLAPRFREMLEDWALHARDAVAKFRAVYARNVDDPWFNQLVQLLRARSPEFADWWNDHDIQLVQEGVKCYRHPEAGRLIFDYSALDIGGEHAPTARMITYVPAPDTDTRAKLEAFLGRDAEPSMGLVS
jgi:transcriptional regulator with XRE-family HTH domain